MVNAAKHKKLKEDVPDRIARLMDSHFFTSQKQIDKARHRKDKVTNFIGIQQERNMLTNYNNETKKRFKASLKEL